MKYPYCAHNQSVLSANAITTSAIRNSAQFDAGAQIAATVNPTSSADQVLPSALKRTSNLYCFVRIPCTAVPGAVFMALISFPRPMMTMLQVPSE